MVLPADWRIAMRQAERRRARANRRDLARMQADLMRFEAAQARAAEKALAAYNERIIADAKLLTMPAEGRG